MLPTARKLAFTDVPVVDLAAAWSGDAAKVARWRTRLRRSAAASASCTIANHRIAPARRRGDLPDRRRFPQSAARREDGSLDARKKIHGQGTCPA